MVIDVYVVYALLFMSLYFEVFLLIAVIQRYFWKPQRNVATGALPSVAIVVPSYNEERGIAATLRSLIALDYPKDKLEIIVVDDGSTDQTLAAAKQFASEPNVKIFSKENGGKHTAMNFALERTSADLIGCLDADSVVEQGALRAIIPVFQNPRVAATTPGIHTKEATNLLQKMQQVEYRLSVFNRFALASIGSAFITPGPFSLFRSDVVKKLGGWRHAYSTEDMEMALRIQEAGFLIGNVPEAIVYTMTPATFRGLFRQRVRWTYGWLRNAVDYRHMFGNRAYGNLGLLILPSAIISIFAGIYFFIRIVYFATRWVLETIFRVNELGFYPHSSFELFYVNTSAIWFLICMSVGVILVLLWTGTIVGTHQKVLPRATPLFLFFYSFLVPLWLGTAVFRAVFRTGVRWR